MRSLAQRHMRFMSDERGAIAMIFGLIAVAFVAVGGMSIDLSRTYDANSRAGAALDSAILAAGEARIRRGVDDAEAREIAERYFLANVAGAGSRANEYSNFQLTISNNGTTFTATSDVSVQTYFAGLVSLDEINFTATSTATFDQLDLELGLMLDVTGSMNRSPRSGGGGSKLEILKRAVSQDLLDTLMPNGDNEKIRVAYAPYSAAVNVGSFAESVRDDNAPASDNCVVERLTATDTDADPSSDRFRSKEEANATIEIDNDAPGYDFYRCPNAEILPLTSSKSTLIQTINSYSASGRTAGHLGIAWAWYLISPEWDSIFGGESAPKDYPEQGDNDLIKAVVLLTDGAFNAAYDGNDGYQPAANESYERAEQLCGNIKAKNVVVFSIGFDLSTSDPNDNDAIDALTDCASTDSRTNTKLYFAANDEDGLQDAFRRIADSLTNLRLTQ